MFSGQSLNNLYCTSIHLADGTKLGKNTNSFPNEISCKRLRTDDLPYTNNQTGWGDDKWTFSNTQEGYNKDYDSLIVKIYNIEKNYATKEYVNNINSSSNADGIVFYEAGTFYCEITNQVYNFPVTTLLPNSAFILKNGPNYTMDFKFQLSSPAVNKVLTCIDNEGTVEWRNVNNSTSIITSIVTNNGLSNTPSFDVQDNGTSPQRGFFFYPTIYDNTYNKGIQSQNSFLASNNIFSIGSKSSGYESITFTPSSSTTNGKVSIQSGKNEKNELLLSSSTIELLPQTAGSIYLKTKDLVSNGNPTSKTIIHHDGIRGSNLTTIISKNDLNTLETGYVGFNGLLNAYQYTPLANTGDGLFTNWLSLNGNAKTRDYYYHFANYDSLCTGITLCNSINKDIDFIRLTGGSTLDVTQPNVPYYYIECNKEGIILKNYINTSTKNYGNFFVRNYKTPILNNTSTKPVTSIFQVGETNSYVSSYFFGACYFETLSGTDSFLSLNQYHQLVTTPFLSCPAIKAPSYSLPNNGKLFALDQQISIDFPSNGFFSFLSNSNNYFEITSQKTSIYNDLYLFKPSFQSDYYLSLDSNQKIILKNGFNSLQVTLLETNSIQFPNYSLEETNGILYLKNTYANLIFFNEKVNINSNVVLTNLTYSPNNVLSLNSSNEIIIKELDQSGNQITKDYDYLNINYNNNTIGTLNGSNNQFNILIYNHQMNISNNTSILMAIHSKIYMNTNVVLSNLTYTPNNYLSLNSNKEIIIQQFDQSGNVITKDYDYLNILFGSHLVATLDGTNDQFNIFLKNNQLNIKDTESNLLLNVNPTNITSTIPLHTPALFSTYALIDSLTLNQHISNTEKYFITNDQNGYMEWSPLSSIQINSPYISIPNNPSFAQVTPSLLPGIHNIELFNYIPQNNSVATFPVRYTFPINFTHKWYYVEQMLDLNPSVIYLKYKIENIFINVYLDGGWYETIHLPTCAESVEIQHIYYANQTAFPLNSPITFNFILTEIDFTFKYTNGMINHNISFILNFTYEMRYYSDSETYINSKWKNIIVNDQTYLTFADTSLYNEMTLFTGNHYETYNFKSEYTNLDKSFWDTYLWVYRRNSVYSHTNTGTYERLYEKPSNYTMKALNQASINTSEEIINQKYLICDTLLTKDLKVYNDLYTNGIKGRQGVSKATTNGYPDEFMEVKRMYSILDHQQHAFNFWWNSSNQIEFWVDETKVLSLSANFSDYRLKSNLKLLPDIFDKILYIPLYSYNLTINSQESNQIGTLAHELQNVFPEFPSLVTGKKDDTTSYQSINYDQLTIILLKTIQEMKQEIKELQNEITLIKSGS